MMLNDRVKIIQRYMTWCRKYKILPAPDSMLDWLIISGALDPVWVSDRDPVIDGEYLVTCIVHIRKKRTVNIVKICTFSDGLWRSDEPENIIAWQVLPEAFEEQRRMKDETF